ncbi:MAG: solute-binding protein [Blautia sp.]|nr:solute-binding protein [Blautia sp.]MDY5031223.1 solute-binding protein [Blautia sp.]
MGSTRDKVGKLGVILASSFFRCVLYICVAVLIFWIGKSTYQFGYNIFNQRAMSPGEGQEVTVVIQEGSSVYEIGKVLQSKGLIEDAKVFVIQELCSNYHNQMKPGTYLLSTAYTPTRMMAIMSGDTEEGGEGES